MTNGYGRDDDGRRCHRCQLPGGARPSVARLLWMSLVPWLILKLIRWVVAYAGKSRFGALTEMLWK